MNRKQISVILVIFLCFPLLLALPNQAPPESVAVGTDEFSTYWYQRGAEISRYDLQQTRYGETRKGHAVLIYVTEELNPELQVKNENPNRSKSEVIPILKLNQIKRFVTGIYDYSMMMSVFSPLDLETYPRTTKVTASVQDWCGQTWLQFNLQDQKYEWEGHSYFEKEADAKGQLQAVPLEDALWTLIRTSPDSLPTGTFQMIPAAFDIRLLHRGPVVVYAKATLKELPKPSKDGRAMLRYSVTFPALKRRMEFDFSSAFPHDILQWRETLALGTSKEVFTVATQTHKTHSAYWKHQSGTDLPLRDALGLDTSEAK